MRGEKFYTFLITDFEYLEKHSCGSVKLFLDHR